MNLLFSMVIVLIKHVYEFEYLTGLSGVIQIAMQNKILLLKDINNLYLDFIFRNLFYFKLILE